MGYHPLNTARGFGCIGMYFPVSGQSGAIHSRIGTLSVRIRVRLDDEGKTGARALNSFTLKTFVSRRQLFRYSRTIYSLGTFRNPEHHKLATRLAARAFYLYVAREMINYTIKLLYDELRSGWNSFRQDASHMSDNIYAYHVHSTHGLDVYTQPINMSFIGCSPRSVSCIKLSGCVGISLYFRKRERESRRE